MKNRLMIILSVLLLFTVTGCASNDVQVNEKEESVYMKLDAEQAKKNLDQNPDIILVDVRTPEEHQQSRIPNSILIPDYEISLAKDILEDKEATIYVYCRSGVRSRNAVLALLEMGYTNVYDIGGIIHWPYETE